MKNILKILASSSLVVFFICSCETSPPPQPLTYLALEKPKGIINTIEHQELEKQFLRGGWYFLNYNFRPAPDVKFFIEQAEKEENTKILKHVDIQFNVPLAVNILLFFGYAKGTDALTVKK
jgi:hypothetical protein